MSNNNSNNKFQSDLTPEELAAKYVMTSYADEELAAPDCEGCSSSCNTEKSSTSKPPSFLSMLGPQSAEAPQNRPFAKTGGYGRSREFYSGNDHYEREMDMIFNRHWLPVEHVSRLKERGAFVTLKFDKIHVLLMRGDNGIKAYHNYCTHRGWCLVEEPSGKREKHLCGYHCWVFDLNGDLNAWNGTYLNPSFDHEKASLRPIRTEVRHGMVFICFNPNPFDIDESLGDFAKIAKIYDLESLECVDTRDDSVDCNWKLVMHNINESLHFPATHPYVHKALDYDDAGVYDVKGNIVSSYNRVRPGVDTASITRQTNRPPFPGVLEEDKDRVIWVSILPNLMFGFSADYIFMQWAWPRSSSTCFVRNHWLFHPIQISQPDFSPDDVVNMWFKTNDEDWEICERTQRGIELRHWEPGFLSLDEEVVHQIDEWVAAQTAPEQK